MGWDWGGAGRGLPSQDYSSLPSSLASWGGILGGAGCPGGRCEVDWWVCRREGNGNDFRGGLLLEERVGETAVVLVSEDGPASVVSE